MPHSTDTCTIYLRTYSDGSLHPLAQISTWTTQLAFFQRFYSGNMQIEFLGDLLAIRFTLPKTSQNQILIWNWKSGALLNRISTEGACSFGFLTSDCLSVFNCSDSWGIEHSIELSLYNNIQQSLASVATGAPGVYISANLTALSPNVVLRFPSRMAPLEYLIQHATSSQRAPLVVNSSTFKIKTDPSVLHLTMAFMQDDYYDDEEDVRISIPDVYDIFVSMAMLLKYTVAPLFPTGHFKPIPWEEWGESSTRWFHSAVEQSSDSGRWVVEGSRAIAANYLPDGGNSALGYVTLLDFNPSTVRRFSSTYDRRLSMWANGPSRHVDMDSPRQDLLHVWEARASNSHEGDVFVDIIDERTPALTTGFGESTVISRLPYHMVTRRIPKRTHSRWILDEGRIVEVPVSSGPVLAKFNLQYTFFTKGKSQRAYTGAEPVLENLYYGVTCMISRCALKPVTWTLY